VTDETLDGSGLVAFDPAAIERLREELEVDIETWRGENVGPRRTTIWLVVVDGLPYVRSIFGDRGRWFADLRLEPHGAVHVGSERIPVRAEPVDSAETDVLEAVSAEFSRKYDGDPDLAGVLTPVAIGATLRLVRA
jgi:hypothetical protein